MRVITEPLAPEGASSTTNASPRFVQSTLFPKLKAIDACLRFGRVGNPESYVAFQNGGRRQTPFAEFMLVDAVLPVLLEGQGK